MMKDLTSIEIIYLNIHKSKAGCWLWQGAKNPKGYGQIRINKKGMLVHRVLYAHHFGEIENGLVVCHKCDTPSCVNPRHLYKGTQKDNLADRDSKGRRFKVYAEHNKKYKLTSKQVIEIRKSHLSLKELAVIYSISRQYVGNIKNGMNRNLNPKDL